MQCSPARVSASLVDMLGRPTAPVAACRDAAATLAGISANDAGAIAACGAQVPAAMVTLARRMLRLLPLAAALGGPGDPILRDVLFHACRCLAVLAYHPDGKVRACLGGGVGGTLRMQGVPTHGGKPTREGK